MLSLLSARSTLLRNFSVGQILSFLQLGLALNNIKGQVSALSILFQRLLASHCFQVILWDLNLVFFALQKPPFKPIQDFPLSTFTHKVVFFVAITSARLVSELVWWACKNPFLFYIGRRWH